MPELIVCYGPAYTFKGVEGLDWKGENFELSEEKTYIWTVDIGTRYGEIGNEWNIVHDDIDLICHSTIQDAVRIARALRLEPEEQK